MRPTRRTCGDDISPWTSARACEADAGMLVSGTHRDTGPRDTLACRTCELFAPVRTVPLLDITALKAMA